MEVEQSEKHKSKHLIPFHWKPGQSGNPNGRPKGKTLKEFAREYLETMPEEDKLAYLATLPAEIVWRMAEGNPHTTEDKKISISTPRPILGGLTQAESVQLEDAAIDALADALVHAPEAPQASLSDDTP